VSPTVVAWVGRFVVVLGLGVGGSDRRSVMAGGLLALACGVSGACSWPDPDKVDETMPDEPLVIEAGEPDAGPTIDWDRPVDGSGFYEEDAWPPACDLLSDDEIRSVLPHARVAKRRSGDQDIDVIGLFGSLGGHMTAVDSTCSFELDIPKAGLGLPDERGSEPAHVDITTIAAGTQGVVSANFHTDGDERLPTAAGECFDDNGTLNCRLERIAFELTSHWPRQSYKDGWTNRYKVDGKTTRFVGSGTDEEVYDEYDRERAFLLRSVELRLAELVLAKG